MTPITQGRAVAIFSAFAAAYFLSTLIRAVMATLAPALVVEFALNARDLGLLAGGYFLGFAAIQLPLGSWLDRLGPKKVVLGLLSVGALACIAFSMASSFSALVAARMLSGVGVSACLMAPLTGYRRWYAASNQMRANSWMLMIGALGMVAATLPVQWLLPWLGWRPMFLALGVLVTVSMGLIFWLVPFWGEAPEGTHSFKSNGVGETPGYAEVWRSPYFRKHAPLGFFNYGGMVALQTLWAAPWLVKVAGYSRIEATAGLFWINVAMLLTYWLWGLANPWLARNGYTADRLIGLGLPLSFVVLAIIVIAGHAVSTVATVLFVLYCVVSTVGAFSQPAVGLAFRPAMAGRALSAYNLVFFCGIFAVQWGIGLLIDGMLALGFSEIVAYQGAVGAFGLCCIAAYWHFLRSK